MHKNARLLLVFFSIVLIFSGCTRKQGPSPAGGGGVTASQSDWDRDIIPDSQLGDDWGLGADGLELRGDSDGIRDGMFNGREMVKGVLPSVYFGFDSSSISASERSKLQQAADHLQANPSDGLLIEGHCDWHGTAEYNLALGDRRAQSAADYLGTLGISSSRIHKLSKGDLEATPGLSKSQAAEDRRADLIILK